MNKSIMNKLIMNKLVMNELIMNKLIMMVNNEGRGQLPLAARAPLLFKLAAEWRLCADPVRAPL